MIIHPRHHGGHLPDLDLTEARWALCGEELGAGILPQRFTIDPYPDSATSYDLVRVEGDEGWYRMDAARTAQARIYLEHQRRERDAARRINGGVGRL